MSDITKVLRDDHARMKRLFLRAEASPEDLSLALDVCDEITIHSTIEEELVYPALRELDAGLADHAEEEHEEAKEIIAELEDMDLDDPGVYPLMRQLKKAVMNHVEEEEGTVFKVLEQGLADQLLEMGSEAFAMRQQLLADRPPRREVMKPETANTGWGGSKKRGSATGNVGW